MAANRNSRPLVASRVAAPDRAETITWIDRAHAIVASTSNGNLEVAEFTIPADEVGRSRAMADIVHAIGDADRVLVVGSEPDRTRLEREYVAIWQRPDRIVDATA